MRGPTPVPRPVGSASGGACRLLVVTYHFPSDGHVGGLRWAGITKYLTRLGWEVAVVTAAPPAGADGRAGARVEWCPRLWTILDACRWLARLDQRARRSFANEGDVARTSGPQGVLRDLRREVAALLAFPDLSRGWLLRAALRTRSLVRQFKPHVVVSSGPPHSAHVVAGIATIGSPVPWFIDLRDPWAGPLGKAWDSDPKAQKLMARAVFPRLERRAFRVAAGVLTSTRQLAEALAARYPKATITCVPNGVDPESLPPPRSDPYPGLGVAYAGTVYGRRDLSPVVMALRSFFGRHPEAARVGSKLRLAGQVEAAHAVAFAGVVGAAGLDQYVELLGPLPRAEALHVVSRSRLAVVLAQDQELQIPAKLYESVAMGIPTLVVAGAQSAAGVEGTRVGALVRDPRDVEGIAGVLERVWQDNSHRRARCPATISYEAIAGQVEEVLRRNGVKAGPCG